MKAIAFVLTLLVASAAFAQPRTGPDGPPDGPRARDRRAGQGAGASEYSHDHERHDRAIATWSAAGTGAVNEIVCCPPSCVSSLGKRRFHLEKSGAQH